MRIDYSEPKKSYISPQPNASRSRKESNPLLWAVIITAVISLAIGFGSGWMLSQRQAKKGFQAAMAQQSLESAPKETAAKPIVQPQPQPSAQPSSAAPQQSQAGSPPTTGGVNPAPETALSFYKALPSGQKSNVLGSGINTDDKAAKQPLQAAIPANLIKPPAQGASPPPKPASPATPEKSAAKPESSGYTVQVASHSLRSEAEALKTKLANKGYNVHIVESNQGDKGIWYRVRVGSKLEHEAARELAAKLGKGALPIPDRD